MLSVIIRGIRQWTTNRFTNPMMIIEITPAFMIISKMFGHLKFKTTNQKLTKVFSTKHPLKSNYHVL